MKARGIILTGGFLLAFISSAFADEIRIPFGVYMDDFKKDCNAHGLDLYGRRDSDGFIEDRARDFSVFTYKRSTDEQLDIIKDSTWKYIRK